MIDCRGRLMAGWACKRAAQGRVSAAAGVPGRLTRPEPPAAVPPTDPHERVDHTQPRWAFAKAHAVGSGGRDRFFLFSRTPQPVQQQMPSRPGRAMFPAAQWAGEDRGLRPARIDGRRPSGRIAEARSPHRRLPGASAGAVAGRHPARSYALTDLRTCALGFSRPPQLPPRNTRYKSH